MVSLPRVSRRHVTERYPLFSTIVSSHSTVGADRPRFFFFFSFSLPPILRVPSAFAGLQQSSYTVMFYVLRRVKINSDRDWLRLRRDAPGNRSAAFYETHPDGYIPLSHPPFPHLPSHYTSLRNSILYSSFYFYYYPLLFIMLLYSLYRYTLSFIILATTLALTMETRRTWYEQPQLQYVCICIYICVCARVCVRVCVYFMFLTAYMCTHTHRMLIEDDVLRCDPGRATPFPSYRSLR